MSYYDWQSAVPHHDSFINNYVSYAGKRTDASYDFHEAIALFLLSIASQGMKLHLPNMPSGLRSNLYIILYGISSHSRKSTSMDIGRDILQRSIPGTELPANFTPGGLEEELAARPYQPASLFSDEFSRVVDQMHNQTYMSGLRQFLLTMYANEDWDYVKTSKGKSKTRDAVEIRGSHLCLMGNVTPTISKYLKPRDIEDGFMARFAIIYPEEKPERKKIGELVMQPLQRNHLVNQLNKIRAACKSLSAEEEHTPNYQAVDMDEDALETLDSFQEEIENSKETETGLIMMERMGIIAIKLSILIAMSHCDPSTMTKLKVEHSDAVAAMSIAKKWAAWGVRFAGSLYESDIDKHIRRALAWLNEFDGKMPRWEIAKKMHLTKKYLDDVQLTMMDRGLISLAEVKSNDSHKPSLYWVMKENQE